MSTSGTAALRWADTWGMILACGLPAIFLFLTCKAQKLFPPSDWRDYYAKSAAEPGRIQLKLAHTYWIAAGVCAVMDAGTFLITPESISEALFWSAVGSGLYWLAILLLILINAYKRERIAALVEQQYRGEMRSFLNVIRSQRHDYNFHVQTIAGLIRRGDLAECRRYVDALEQDTQEMNAVLPIRDPAVSATIHNFRLLAAREGIRLHIDIRNDLAQIATSAYETNKIIGNLLQNAIDETQHHQDKSAGILLNILKRNEFCVIRVSNALEGEPPSAGEIGQFYHQGFTTKAGHEGVGLSSIRVLAGRYGGSVETQLEDRTIHFIARVPINSAKRATPEGEEDGKWS